jgi:hypothetical protein
VAHQEAFAALVARLGAGRAQAVRSELNRIVERMPPDKESGRRKFNSSHLGSSLTPWEEPLSYLYELASADLGANAPEDLVQERAALFFGQFVWECIMNRDEKWVFYDPNLSAKDPNRQIVGKSYFERG